MSVDTLLLMLGPDSNGTSVSADEFDTGEAVPGWRYELIRGIVIVSPTPSRRERDPNEELGHLLRNYQEMHPQGRSLDKTLSEEDIHIGDDRRRADRAIWAGLGRRPKRFETPTIAVEFVSSGRRNRARDYEEKRDEYLSVSIREYWIIDRFTRTMTVYSQHGTGVEQRVISETDAYSTPLLPGFKLPLSRLFALADEWDSDEPESSR